MYLYVFGLEGLAEISIYPYGYTEAIDVCFLGSGISYECLGSHVYWRPYHEFRRFFLKYCNTGEPWVKQKINARSQAEERKKNNSSPKIAQLDVPQIRRNLSIQSALTLHSGVSSTMIFSGLRSRWTTGLFSLCSQLHPTFRRFR